MARVWHVYGMCIPQVARLRMSNELMNRELHKLKSLVGAGMPGEGGGVDVDALVPLGHGFWGFSRACRFVSGASLFALPAPH